MYHKKNRNGSVLNTFEEQIHSTSRAACAGHPCNPAPKAVLSNASKELPVTYIIVLKIYRNADNVYSTFDHVPQLFVDSNVISRSII